MLTCEECEAPIEPGTQGSTCVFEDGLGVFCLVCEESWCRVPEHIPVVHEWPRPVGA